MRETASARRQAPRHVASILDAARELGIRDAQACRGAPLLFRTQTLIWTRVYDDIVSFKRHARCVPAAKGRNDATRQNTGKMVVARARVAGHCNDAR